MQMAISKSRDHYINMVKAVGQTIIDRVDDIIGDITNCRKIDVSFIICPDEITEIKVIRHVIVIPDEE